MSLTTQMNNNLIKRDIVCTSVFFIPGILVIAAPADPPGAGRGFAGVAHREWCYINAATVQVLVEC